MIEPRLFLCSGTVLSDDDPRREGRKIVPLDALGPDANIHLRLEDVARVFLQHLTPRLTDLLEIAAYIFTADATTQRGTAWEHGAVEPWTRDFRMVIPVRDLSFWTSPEVSDVLTRTLRFLSDDLYQFDFEPLRVERPRQEYLEIGGRDEWPFTGLPRVCLFSGGLDSLAGAVEMAAKGEPLVLVSHRPVASIASRQRGLVSELRKQFPDTPLLHIPVWVNKEARFGREFTQRTRSFLFSALGCVVSESVGAEGIRFFENGVVSLNLPVADEVLSARASRTTHPQALHLFSKLYSLVTDRPEDQPFAVDNPYLYSTKAEIVERIGCNGAGSLIAYSCSCAHTIHKSKSQWHCGTCSQCIDRRIAILAAGFGEYDPAMDYVVDVFTGPRKEGYERNMAVDYARHVTELNSMDGREIAERFNRELTAAVRFTAQRREAAEELIALHQRHAATAMRVLTEQVNINASALLSGGLSETAMLALVAGQQHRATVWQRYVERIGTILSEAIPVACHTEKPKNEPRLQELADGILTGHELTLRREYPFLSWASVRTKPDWSAESLGLWVELKYLRESRDRVPVTEAIAADITKYGSSGRRTLFVVYDPARHLADDALFVSDITRHDGMFVKIIR